MSETRDGVRDLVDVGRSFTSARSIGCDLILVIRHLAMGNHASDDDTITST